MVEELYHRVLEALETGWLVVFTAVVLLIGPLLSVIAWRRWRGAPDASREPCSVVPEATALVMLGMPITLANMGDSIASQIMAAAIAETDLGNRASLIAQSFSTQINVDSFLAITGLLNAALMGTALAGLVASRLKTAEGRVPILGGLAVALMVLSTAMLSTGSLLRISALTRLPGHGPGENRALAVQAKFQEALPFLQTGAGLALVALTIGAGLLGLALARTKPPLPVGPRTGLMAAGLLVASALVVAQTLPYATENQLPLPFTRFASALPKALRVTPPDLQGPSQLKGRAAIITVGPRLLDLDGIIVPNLPALDLKLGERRKLYTMMHPGLATAPSANMILVVDQSLQAARLIAVLGTAARRGYTQYFFAFVHQDPPQIRPLLGTYSASHESWLTVTLARPGTLGALQVDPEETFKNLARRSLEAAKPDQPVQWVVSQETAEP